LNSDGRSLQGGLSRRRNPPFADDKDGRLRRSLSSGRALRGPVGLQPALRAAADPGSTLLLSLWVPALRSSVRNAAPRPEHERNVLPLHFLHQTRLTNLQRGHSVPRTQRSAQRCAVEPRSTLLLSLWVPALRSNVKDAAPRPGHERNLLSPACGDLPVGRLSDRAVYPPLQKYFASPVRANHLYKFAPSHPTRGAYHDRHERGVGCGGRGSVLRAMGWQGG
jgi:hypothetical protein